MPTPFKADFHADLRAQRNDAPHEMRRVTEQRDLRKHRGILSERRTRAAIAWTR